MRRRALLAALTATAGCSGLTDFDDAPAPESRSSPDTSDTTDTADLPYRGDDSARPVEPRGFTVQNQTDRERYVTVVVEREGETVFVENESIPPRESESNGRRVYEELVAAAGIYRVIVETADGGRTVHDWVVGPDVGGLFVVLEEDYAWSRQQVVCDPLCGPISLGGEAVESLPYVPERDGEDDRSPRPGTSNLVFANTGETPREVHAVAEFEGETLLDYRYDIRPGLQVAVPLTSGFGVVDLTLEADGTTERYEWHVPEEEFVFSDVADGVGVNCRLPRQYRNENDQEGVSLRGAHNRSNEAQTLTVTARADGEAVADEQFELAPDTRRRLDVRLQAEDGLDLTLELATGERVAAHWYVCPSRPQEFSVGVDADGTLALLRWDRPVATSGDWNDERQKEGSDEPTVTTAPGDESSPTPTPETTPTEATSTETPEDDP